MVILKLEIDFGKINQFYKTKKRRNMRARGGGILDIDIVNKTDLEPNYYQLEAKFETCEAMGANFINSLLEKFSKILEREIQNSDLDEDEKRIVIIMCILSNYTPECLVRCEVSCSVDELNVDPTIDTKEFAKKFEQAIHVANIEPTGRLRTIKAFLTGLMLLL